MLGPRRQRDGAFYAPSSPPPATPRSPPTTPLPHHRLCQELGGPARFSGWRPSSTVDGVRYLMANGDPRAVEEGTRGITSALIGYALAALAPTLLSILEHTRLEKRRA